MKLKNVIGHFKTITKHRHKVMRLCFKVGIPFRGLLHDLSKYSPCEFFEGAKYFAGTYSPITNCKKAEGYSKAWLHHFGRNKHHFEYWYDYNAPVKTPFMPFKYVCEMICDNLAAGLTYQGKNWTKEYQLKYFNDKKDRVMLNNALKDMLTEVYEQVAEKGIDEVITKKNLKKLYDKYEEIDKERNNTNIDTNK